MKKKYKPGFYIELDPHDFGAVWIFTHDNKCLWFLETNGEWVESTSNPNGYLDDVKLELVGEL